MWNNTLITINHWQQARRSYSAGSKTYKDVEQDVDHDLDGDQDGDDVLDVVGLLWSTTHVKK